MRAFLSICAALVAIACFLVALLPMPVRAQGPACSSLPDTIVSLSAQGVPYAVLGPTSRDQFVRLLERRFGLRLPPVRNVLIAQPPNGIFYGLEFGDCRTAPQPLVIDAPPPRRSGMTPTGVYA